MARTRHFHMRIATECEPLGAHRASSNEYEPVLIPWLAPSVHSDRCEPWKASVSPLPPSNEKYLVTYGLTLSQNGFHLIFLTFSFPQFNPSEISQWACILTKLTYSIVSRIPTTYLRVLEYSIFDALHIWANPVSTQIFTLYFSRFYWVCSVTRLTHSSY